VSNSLVFPSKFRKEDFAAEVIVRIVVEFLVLWYRRGRGEGRARRGRSVREFPGRHEPSVDALAHTGWWLSTKQVGPYPRVKTCCGPSAVPKPIARRNSSHGWVGAAVLLITWESKANVTEMVLGSRAPYHPSNSQWEDSVPCRRNTVVAHGLTCGI
jgi:hypothetical protein